MTTYTLNLPEKQNEALEKAAQATGIAANDLLQDLMMQVIDNQADLIEGTVTLSPEELEQLKRDIAEDEADEAAGIEYTSEDFRRVVKETIANYQKNQRGSNN